MMMRSNQLGLLAGMLLPVVAAAQSAAFADRESQAQLAAGKVAVSASIGGHEPGGQVHAAVKIHARPETVWHVMRECESAPSYIPGLKRCRRIDRASDGSWEIIEHEVKYSWLMPAIHSVLRLEYRPWEIDFHRLSGDLKAEDGTWRVQGADNGKATIVEYQLHVEPGFWVPSAIVRASLRRELPAALLALRSRVESIEAQGPRRTASVE
jgi:hypothetical protein